MWFAGAGYSPLLFQRCVQLVCHQRVNRADEVAAALHGSALMLTYEWFVIQESYMQIDGTLLWGRNRKRLFICEEVFFFFFFSCVAYSGSFLDLQHINGSHSHALDCMGLHYGEHVYCDLLGVDSSYKKRKKEMKVYCKLIGYFLKIYISITIQWTWGWEPQRG